ncbi:hypothetical protein FJ365_04385 [Candidatus Dependentiae bacterium]|nr:hypothetical protein [Candidatus Dependentiae bacterium]
MFNFNEGNYMELRGKQAFSLIEMLLVVGLIVLIFSFMGPKIMKMFGKNDKAEMQFKMAGIQSALNDYRMDFGTYPSTREGLQALVENPRPNDEKYNRVYSKGAYLKENDIVDKAGNEIIYNCPPELNKGKFNAYELVYLGKTQSEDDPDRLDVGA